MCNDRSRRSPRRCWSGCHSSGSHHYSGIRVFDVPDGLWDLIEPLLPTRAFQAQGR